MTSATPEHESYRGQWGGKLSNGEEMWWSEADAGLARGSWTRRLRFWLDVRQHFLLRYLAHGLGRAKAKGVQSPVVVDFGCGTGGSTLNFSSYVGVPFHGFDIFPTQIRIAREFAIAQKNSSRFDVLDGNGKLPLPAGSVDVIYSADVLGHVPDIQATLADWARVLKPGGTVALFTESNYSAGDRSLMAQLARRGMDMNLAVDEHISLFPRETLEKWFTEAGFEVVEKASANVLHWVFFPKDYVMLFDRHQYRGPLYWLSYVWMKVSKVTPFYPTPIQTFRLVLTRLFGSRAYGTGYFFELRKRG